MTTQDATASLPWVAVLAEELVGNRLGSGVYRGWVESLGLAGDEAVLDIGTGGGACARHLAWALRRGGLLTCVEIDAAWVEIASRRLGRFDNVEVVQADACEWSRPGAYDVVTIHFVLHDIDRARRASAVRAARANLRDGGRLCVREPIAHGMTAEELASLLADAGFERMRPDVLGSVPLMGATVSGVWEKPARR